MEKRIADKCIFEYRDRIFGFALDKTRNIDQARELASDIIYEVYRSFLRKDDIVNLDGYVYRIARNVWAQYAARLINGRCFDSIYDMEIAAPEDNSGEDYEMAEQLRREIGYLSDRQRLVIYLHYYDDLSVSDIAKRLNISQGTVKWHLSDARTKLKEGIDMNINEQNLELNPIRFINMGHSGTPGSTGDTNDMFDSRLKQNIAWACYWQPKTLEEIARMVGVPQIYVADNLAKLVDYAYIDRLDNSKNPNYRTNMMITDHRASFDCDPIFDKAAEILCDKYFPEVFREFESDPDHWGLSCSNGDINYLKYNVVMAAIGRLTLSEREWKDYEVIRPDGGCFIAFASVTDDTAPAPKPFPYWTCGTMTRSGSDINEAHISERSRSDMSFVSVSVDCRYADRSGGWQDNLSTDWAALVKYIDGGRDSLTAEEYKRLCDKGYVYEGKVMPTILKTNSEPDYQSLKRVAEKHIAVSDEIKAVSEQLDDEYFDKLKVAYPDHMQPVARQQCCNVLAHPVLIPMTVERLLDKGLLQPLNDAQRKTVFSILCIKK